ncbi:TonB-dependent receptor [Qipengyuania zhejiangensis]|uniref:TonB-dependent receptor n=1 Tax=Qipengyuania zhejiangensis TaxID=3077782 RepID=UPI002D788533|nr:TonB-dependent receptor [Qipengyuania sp. Z2]
MRVRATLLAGICASAITFPAHAQEVTDDELDNPRLNQNVIVVTAQRQSQSLQEVPIAVSAFNAEALEAQQIENASDLQLTLPNVSFTKSNFTGSSFTIRGIGDLCVGTSCDAATGIHTNGSPLFGTRLFETEYFDLERVEVLRGPQGTLFGRNATSGVVNVVTAKPELGAFRGAAEFEYGNFNSMKAKAMVNVPIGDTIAARVAGFWLNRDGYTYNTYTDSDIDDRDMYAIRGSLRFEPSATTTLDLMGYYFREKDSRLRIQKQQCQRDDTGVLGCLNNRRDFDSTNTNSTFTGTLGSQQFFGIFLGSPQFGLNNLYGPDSFNNYDEPDDVRVVGTPFKPEYFADELQLQAHLDQDIGAFNLSLTGMYQETSVNSRQDYNLGIGDRSILAGGLNTLQAYADNPLTAAYFAPVAAALIPQGPNGPLCTSDTRVDGQGAFEGYSICGDTPGAFDRSSTSGSAWSAEAILSSDFDGPFNFLLGGIYAKAKAKNTDYFVNAFAIDYITGVVGALASLGTLLDANPANDLPPSYAGTSYYRNNNKDFELDSFGIFGEVYFDISDKLKFTGGLRYNDDKKALTARTTLLSFFVPHGLNADPFTSPIFPNGPFGPFDADPGTAGLQDIQVREVGFNEITGRAVLDYQITPDNLIYLSYSRGYKSGGINPPLSPIFEVSDSFGSEKIDAFEIGTKNTIGNGALQLNATAFYYKYKGLQLSRIIARTSVNDTIDANIWGVELESILRPADNWLINANFSYLSAKVAGDQLFSNPRDPGGGDPDAVIIKDITNGALCAVTGAGANAFVAAVNAGLGLAGPAPFASDGGIASNGAFSICSALDANTANPAFDALGPLAVLSPGVEVNLKGNKLPQAPEMKASIGVQYTAEFGSGMTLVPRVDVAFTGEQYDNVFNGRVNRIEPFVQANASIQLNSANDTWFVRGFVQNIFDSDSVTGLYVTDASSGLFSNIFTLDPRRYGIAIGAKF